MLSQICLAACLQTDDLQCGKTLRHQKFVRNLFIFLTVMISFVISLSFNSVLASQMMYQPDFNPTYNSAGGLNGEDHTYNTITMDTPEDVDGENYLVPRRPNAPKPKHVVENGICDA